MTVDKMTKNKMIAEDKMTVAKITLYKMIVYEMTLNKIIAYDMTVDKMTFDEMSVDEMTVDEMSWSCRLICLVHLIKASLECLEWL
jgi:hypothetical protein